MTNVAPGGCDADSTDRRRNVVTTTASDPRHRDELQQHADAVQDDLLHGLDATERQQVRGLLAKALSSHASQPA